MSDHYIVKPTRLEVFRTGDGLGAELVRRFPVRRQVYLMRAAADGLLFVAGPDLYKMDVHSGKYEVAVPVRKWGRPNYSRPDVLYFWPHHTALQEFSMLFTTAKFTDERQNLVTADCLYGYKGIDLNTGKSTA